MEQCKTFDYDQVTEFSHFLSQDYNFILASPIVQEPHHCKDLLLLPSCSVSVYTHFHGKQFNSMVIMTFVKICSLVNKRAQSIRFYGWHLTKRRFWSILHSWSVSMS